MTVTSAPTAPCQPFKPKVIRVSWSQLRVHSECKARGKLQRAGHRTQVSDIRGFFHGTVADRALRAYLDGGCADKGGMARTIREVCDREETLARETGDGIVKWRNRSDREDMLKFCTELAHRLEPIIERDVAPHDYQPSRRFAVPVTIPYLDGNRATIMLVGETDILLRTVPVADEERRWRVWDLKATQDDGYWRKTIGQLVFYDLACAAEFGEKTEMVGLIQPMCKVRVLPLVVTDQQRAEMMQRVIAFCTAVWRDELGDEGALPTRIEEGDGAGGCSWCDVKHACSTFSRSAGGRVTLLGGGDTFADLV